MVIILPPKINILNLLKRARDAVDFYPPSSKPLEALICSRWVKKMHVHPSVKKEYTLFKNRVNKIINFLLMIIFL